VTDIAVLRDDADTFVGGASELRPYEPIFGYGLENFTPHIKAGSIYESDGAHFNMTNPSSLVFPEINQAAPFDLISVEQRRQLEDFASRRQPGWRLPFLQQILDWVSPISLIAALAAVFIPSRGRRHSHRTL
jgi:hypothetical protein